HGLDHRHRRGHRHGLGRDLEHAVRRHHHPVREGTHAMRKAWTFGTVIAACTLALAGCSDRADTNPNAPGSPGTGNTAEVVRPAAPDGPPGGPSGIAGSGPHTGGSGADVMPGTTGSSGTAEAGGRGQP